MPGQVVGQVNAEPVLAQHELHAHSHAVTAYFDIGVVLEDRAIAARGYLRHASRQKPPHLSHEALPVRLGESWAQIPPDALKAAAPLEVGTPRRVVEYCHHTVEELFRGSGIFSDLCPVDHGVVEDRKVLRVVA